MGYWYKLISASLQLLSHWEIEPNSGYIRIEGENKKSNVLATLHLEAFKDGAFRVIIIHLVRFPDILSQIVERFLLPVSILIMSAFCVPIFLTALL